MRSVNQLSVSHNQKSEATKLINKRQPLDIIDFEQMTDPYLKGMEEIRCFTRIFPDPCQQGGSWEKSFKVILDLFAKCLRQDCQEGVTNWMIKEGPHRMFFIPFEEKCMLIDWEKVQMEAAKVDHLVFKSHKGRSAKNRRTRHPPYLEAKIGKGERHHPSPRSRCKEIMLSAHRVLCFVRHGHPPLGKEMVLHTCEQSHCLNPLHLKWGDAKENSCHLSNSSKSGVKSVSQSASLDTQLVDNMSSTEKQTTFRG
jgi:hypothetical protein